MKDLFYWILNTTVFSFTFWLLVTVYYGSKIAITFGSAMYRKSKFPQLIKKRREECDRSFQFDVSIDDIPAAMREKIMHSDLSGLKKLIWSQEVSSEQVLRFFFYRLSTVGRELKAAIESNFKDALRLAKEADQLIKEQPENKLPPLCGLPISIKENYYMKGFEITQGMETRLGVKQERTAPLIEHLIKQGAIPFVRSNIPQALFTSESENVIFGQCANPHNKARSAGGSSGGEASLISAGCSPAGLGNDIGGSIRIPSAFCGIFGFKPTTGRLNVKDQLSPVHPYHETDTNQHYIQCCNGPLAKSVNDIKMIMEEMTKPEINHLALRSLPPLPWRQEATTLPAGAKLTIGYFESADDIFECHPAGQRAVREVVEALTKAGHSLIKVEVPYQREIYNLTCRIFLSDGFIAPFVSFANGMTMINGYKLMQIMYLVPHCIKMLLAKILQMLGKERFALMLLSSSPIPAKDIFVQANGQILITSEFLKSLQDKNIQFLISPSFGVPAIRHGTSGDLLPAAFYTFLYNFLGMPAGTLPVTKIRKDEQTYNSKHDDIVTKFAKEALIDSEGLPVGVQVAAMPFKDEECLSLMQHIETSMKLKPFLKC